VTGYGLDKGSSLGTVKNFLVSTSYIPALSTEVQRLEREADNSSPSSAEVKKM
jgi:hypothetical protein